MDHCRFVVFRTCRAPSANMFGMPKNQMRSILTIQRSSSAHSGDMRTAVVCRDLLRLSKLSYDAGGGASALEEFSEGTIYGDSSAP
jgi:hypothetical protein